MTENNNTSTGDALLQLAAGWVDRWNAIGGDFGARYNPDGSFHGLMRGVPEPDYWTPTDEGREDLPPHVWLVEQEHQRGALKVLDALLILVPGLQDAVYDIAAAQVPAAQQEA